MGAHTTTQESVLWTYDNSMVVTLNSATDQTFSVEDFPKIHGNAVTVGKKEFLDGSRYGYDCIISLDSAEDAATAMTAVTQNALVSKVQRNYYLENYSKCASFLTLNAEYAFVPVDSTAELQIVDLNLISSDYTYFRNRFFH